MNNKYLLLLMVSLFSACGAKDEPSSSSSSASSSSSSSSSSTSSSGGAIPNTGLVISEVVVKSAADHFLGGNDWIELQNKSDGPINLSEYRIKDSTSELIALPNFTVQAGGYFVIQAADAESAGNAAFLPFKLGSEDSISLYSGTTQQIDSLSWLDGDAKEGRSYGRLDNKNQTLYPTPDIANVPYVLFSDEKVFTLKVLMKDSDWKTLLAEGQKEDWYPADLEFNGAVIKEIAIRTKGQSSLGAVSKLKASDKSYGRYGFKLDLNKYKEQKFMGMKSLVLNNGFADPTMMRDAVAYRLMKEVGMPAPELSYVDLWVAGEHLGVYQLIEPIDGEFVEKYFPDDDKNDFKGDLYKAEFGSSLQWKSGNTIKDFAKLELKTNEETIGTAEEGKALLAFLQSSNTGSDQHIDIDNMLRYIAANILTSNLDGYFGTTTQNYYLYEHRSIQRFTMLPWDYNLAFGAINFGGGGGGGGGASCDSTAHLIDNPTTGPLKERPILARVLEKEENLAVYHGHLETLLANIFNPTDMAAYLKKKRDLIEPYVKNDPTSFYTFEQWKNSLTEKTKASETFFGDTGALMTFIQARYENVRRQLDGDIPSGNSGKGACPE